MTDKDEPIRLLPPDDPIFSNVYGVTFRRKSKRSTNATPEQQAFWKKNKHRIGQKFKDEVGTLESWIAEGGTKESAKEFGIE